MEDYALTDRTRSRVFVHFRLVDRTNDLYSEDAILRERFRRD
jgi:hypothetical protein